MNMFVNKKNKKEKAFTLIEVVVVIAIIGILASIVLVSVGNIKERARIVAGLQFSQSVKNGLGGELAGEWSFNETGNGTCVEGGPFYDDFCDSSGNNNNGGNFNTSRSVNIEIPQLGQKAGFTGTSSSHVLVPNSSTLNIINAITIESWVKTNPGETSWGVLGKTFAYGLYVRSGYVYFYINGSGPSTITAPDCSDSAFRDNKWHHFAATWEPGSKRRVFIDGKEICSDNPSGGITPSIYNLYIGRGINAVYSLNGSLDEVRLYSASLSSAQIQQRYAEGAKKRGLLVKE